MILYIIGAGGHGKVAAEVAILMNSYKEIVFLDEKIINTHSLSV